MCSVSDCGRAAYKRQMCNAHYLRVRRYGDPNTIKVSRYGPGATCSVDTCEARPIAKGLCKLHYDRLNATGSTDPPRRSPAVHGAGGSLPAWPDRLWSKVEMTNTCWLWTGALTRPYPHGYGTIRHNGRRLTTHRVAYELLVGPIPKGRQLDHLCRVRACCNPAHLEPVTPAENVARGVSIPSALGKQIQCKRGHEFTTENTRMQANGTRRCRACAREAGRTCAARRRDA